MEHGEEVVLDGWVEEFEVDESGACNFGWLAEVVVRERGKDFGGDLARVGFELAGEGHGGIGLVVAEARVCGGGDGGGLWI